MSDPTDDLEAILDSHGFNVWPGQREAILRKTELILLRGRFVRRLTTNPCLMLGFSKPGKTWVSESISHYMTVSSPGGGVGGRKSCRPRARSTWRARGLETLTPVRTPPSTWKVT
jgi:hypothetical protein